MINFIDQVPSIYPSASRDFQYLSWLINTVLNSVKHSVDGLYNLPNTGDPRLTELLAMTLGFKVKRNYDKDQLIALVSIIPSILKYKGTKKAITMVIDALIMASGTVGDFDSDSDAFFKIVDDTQLEITLPKDLLDVTLFTDVLPYILPAGMTCKISRKNIQAEDLITKLAYNDLAPKTVWHADLTWKEHVGSGLANMFTVPATAESGILPEFTNYLYQEGSNHLQVNTGLLGNTIIPTLDPNNVQEPQKEEGD